MYFLYSLFDSHVGEFEDHINRSTVVIQVFKEE